MQIRTPPLSGNQRQKPPLRPSTVVLWSQRAKEEREREKLISAFVEFPHLPLEEAVHLVVPFINVSLSFSLFFSLYPFFPSTLKVRVSG